ncbi:hypothetical protein SAMD00019534_005790 [Acytostelium subglobosum LB1]|uniref:hypothetical protein n=1 Tax=Acytostelium subglobosum LB1 TaxID=1410327 RepID=UPI0006451574|nr:hypothetical protein SAMD00019534_005790 [Acytostelium subglobosum LB1]GAM17404.1 hypothetical protein SAMD00019534_005790 [Acytostelium subglobosum LB1]|eukprot:XP_012759466.1 hypothetical protein SAMD00019534_005790 [Acytostelium subglobosum LB1]
MVFTTGAPKPTSNPNSTSTGTSNSFLLMNSHRNPGGIQQQTTKQVRSDLAINLFDTVDQKVTSTSTPFTHSKSTSPSNRNSISTTSSSSTTTTTSTSTSNGATSYTTPSDMLEDLIDHSKSYTSKWWRPASASLGQTKTPITLSSPDIKNKKQQQQQQQTQQTQTQKQDSEQDIESLLMDIDSLVIDIRGIEDNLRSSCAEISALSNFGGGGGSSGNGGGSGSGPGSPIIRSQPSPHIKPMLQLRPKMFSSSDSSLPTSHSTTSHSHSHSSLSSQSHSQSQPQSPSSSPTLIGCSTDDYLVSDNTTMSPSTSTSSLSSLSSSSSPASGSPSTSSWLSGTISRNGKPTTLAGATGENKQSSALVTGNLRSSQWSHPRSSTDPSKYSSFTRTSVVNLDPVNPQLKHRSTFPGSLLLADQQQHQPTSPLSGSGSSKSTSSSNSPASSPRSNNSGNGGSNRSRTQTKVSSPDLTTILPASITSASILQNKTSIVFGGRGMECFNANNRQSQQLDQRYYRSPIDLDNPQKMKRLKELLKSYNAKIITLINKISKDCDDMKEKRQNARLKFEKKSRLFHADNQLGIYKSYHEYYVCNDLVLELVQTITDQKRDNLKRKLVDIVHMTRYLDDESIRRHLHVYSSFFSKTVDLMSGSHDLQRNLRRRQYLTKRESRLCAIYKNAKFNYTSDTVEKRTRRLKEMVARAVPHPDFHSYFPWDENLDIQREFDIWVLDSRFVEGRHLKELVSVISEDVITAKKIVPLDIEDFVDKFTAKMIAQHHIAPTVTLFETPTQHLLSQMTKRTLYPRIYSLTKSILNKCVGSGASIRYDMDFQAKMDQLRTKTIRELNLLPSNLPEHLDYARDKPFEGAVSILNEAAFHVVPIDIVYTVQRAISMIHNVSVRLMAQGSVRPTNAFARAIHKVAATNSLINQIISSPDGPAAADHHVQYTQQQQQQQPQTRPRLQTSRELVAGNTVNGEKSTMSADDLFPLFIYTLIHSNIIGCSALLVSQLQHFAGELESGGEFGWCSVSFQAAISHLDQM